MSENFVSESSVVVNAKPGKVWEALTNPEMIKQYLFGTEASSDWQVGSPITYKGSWEGKSYEDKGTILISEPEKRLKTTYWSSIGGTEDLPENYKNVDYVLTPIEGGTKLTIFQDNNKTVEEKDRMEKNWNSVLSEFKKVVEQ